MQEEPQTASTEAPKKHSKSVLRLLSNNPKLVATLVLAVVVILGGWGVYSNGYNKGKKQGVKDAAAAQKKEATSSLLAIPASGTVSEISDTKITIKLLGTETRTATIDSQTTVSSKAGKATVNDIKAGDKVILFSKTSGDSQVATRILVQ